MLESAFEVLGVLEIAFEVQRVFSPEIIPVCLGVSPNSRQKTKTRHSDQAVEPGYRRPVHATEGYDQNL